MLSDFVRTLVKKVIHALPGILIQSGHPINIQFNSQQKTKWPRFICAHQTFQRDNMYRALGGGQGPA